MSEADSTFLRTLFSILRLPCHPMRLTLKENNLKIAPQLGSLLQGDKADTTAKRPFLPVLRLPHSAASATELLSSANFVAIVGLDRVNFLIVTSCALSLARRRLRSVPIKASLVFCK